MGTFRTFDSNFQSQNVSQNVFTSRVETLTDHLLSIWAPIYSTEHRRGMISRYLGEEAASLDDPPVVGIGKSKSPWGTAQLELLTTVDSDVLDLEKLRMTARLEQTAVHVTRTGRIFACGRPAQGGDSIGFRDGPTGTLGCLVRDKDGQVAILSCNHVIAATNQGQRNKDTIWQPGKDDRGSAKDSIGILSDYKEIEFGKIAKNEIDAALCLPNAGDSVLAGIRGLGHLTGHHIDPALGLAVKKVGRKSGKTEGILQFNEMGFIVTVDQDKEALFVKQLGIVSTGSKAFAKQGDSGALVVDSDNKAVGLLFAIAADTGVALANPILNVLHHLKIELV